MRGQSHAQIKVARASAAGAFLALARDTDGLSFLDAGWNSNFEIVRFGLAGAGVGALQRNGPHRAVHHFVEGDEDVAFDVAAASGARRLSELFRVEPVFGDGKSETAAASEESFEEVA